MSDYDNTEIARIQKRMQECTKKLNELAPAMGQAKQVREFSGDRRKSILAMELVKSLKAGESAAASDAIARASEGYRIALDEQGKQLADAETVIATWGATEASFEAARSLLSMMKSTMKL